MARIACAFVARYELSLRARVDPGLGTRMLALADVAKGQGRLLEVTEPAERHGLRVDMRLSHARALCPALELVPPDPSLRENAERELLLALSVHSPLLDLDHLGAFFLGLEGLQRLVDDEARFVEGVRGTFERLGLFAKVAVADTPWVAWVAARQGDGETICVVGPGAETRFLASIPLAELSLSERAQELFRLLGLRWAGELLTLPKGALARRLGPDGVALERLLRGEGRIANPSSAQVPTEPEEVSLELDGPTEALEPILFLLRSLVDRLLAALGRNRSALAELKIEARLDDRTWVRHALVPAEPTLDAGVVMDLLRLWLGARPFGAPVAEVRLVAARAMSASPRQLELFAQREEKELLAWDRAVANLTAAFGRDAVSRPVLGDTFRPEARLSWQAVQSVESSRASATRGNGPVQGERRYPSTGSGQAVPESKPPGAARARDEPSGPIFRRQTGPSNLRLRAVRSAQAERASPDRMPGQAERERIQERDGRKPLALRLLDPPEPVSWTRSGLFLRPNHSPLQVRTLDGPHRLTGEWWDAPFDRTYAWLSGNRGELFWVFRDEHDGAFYLHAVGD